MQDLTKRLEASAVSYQALTRDGSRYTFTAKDEVADKLLTEGADKKRDVSGKSHLLLDGTLTAHSYDMLNIAFFILKDLKVQYIEENSPMLFEILESLAGDIWERKHHRGEEGFEVLKDEVSGRSGKEDPDHEVNENGEIEASRLK